MKSSKLIAELQRLDPEGEVEVCVGNEDIHFPSREPAYYDGPLQVYQRDMSQNGYFNIRGVKRTYSGDKIQMHSYSIADLFADQPDMPITYEGMYPESEQRFREQDKAIRERVRAEVNDDPEQLTTTPN